MPENLKLLLSPSEVDSIVSGLGSSIEADYGDKVPVVVGVLKGAAVFLADLVRAVSTPLEIDFLQAASYHGGTAPKGEVRIVRDLTTDVAGRDVIVVEGIVDKGKTVEAVTRYLKAKGASSVKVCALLVRGTAPVERAPDYAGRTIGDGFVVGYGMDFKERYRNLPGLYTIEPEEG